jgi:hypothetical protein
MPRQHCLVRSLIERRTKSILTSNLLALKKFREIFVSDAVLTLNGTP